MKSSFPRRKRTRRSASLANSLVLMTFAAGCSGEQAPPSPASSDPPSPEVPESPPAFYCQQTAQAVPENNQAPPNFPRRERPAPPSGQYQTTVQWQPSAEGHQFSGAEQRSELVVRVDATTAPVWITRAVANRNPLGSVPAEVTKDSLGCFDTLHTTASLSLVSADGLLNESFTVELEAQPSGVWIGRSEHRLDDLNGNFTANLALPAGYAPEQAPLLRGHWAIAGETLVGDLELDSGPLIDSAAQLRDPGVSERIAHFPPGNQCDRSIPVVTPRALERRAAMSEALARLNAVGSVTMVSHHANSPLGPLTLHFAEADATICQDSAPPAHSVVLTRSQLELRSDDGRVAGSFPVELVVLHEPSLIEATAEVAAQADALTDELPSRLAIADPLDLSAYARASAQFVTVLNGSELSGSLQLSASFADSCSTDSGLDAGTPSGERLGDQPPVDAGAPDPDASVRSLSGGTSCGTQPLWSVSWGSESYE